SPPWGEACLTGPAGPDDRGDPDRAQQVRHRGDVVVAAEQRVGLVGPPVADDRGGALEQLRGDGAEGAAGSPGRIAGGRLGGPDRGRCRARPAAGGGRPRSGPAPPTVPASPPRRAAARPAPPRPADAGGAAWRARAAPPGL